MSLSTARTHRPPTRSVAWGANGAAATAHPLATLAAIDMLRRGGSAIDAAICANICLGFLEPTACGIGGDVFALLWDPAAKQVVGFNGSGRSPRSLTLEIQRQRADQGHIRRFGATSVSTPGAVEGWARLHQRYGRLDWAQLWAPGVELCEAGAPIPAVIAAGWRRNLREYLQARDEIGELKNFAHTFAPWGRAPKEGELFRNPDLGRSYRLIAEQGPDVFYRGEIAETIERYFQRIGGWLSRADLEAHAGEWTQPHSTGYRGVEVYGLGPNTTGVTTLQMLGMLEQFDLAGMGPLSAQSIHHQAEAKRLAFEDRARYFADPAFASAPVEWLLSKDYAAERARMIRPDRVMQDVGAGEAPSQGGTTCLSVADRDGMMVSLIQSNFRGMGSGLVADGLGFTFQNRGELFSLQDGHANLYAPGKRPFHTIIPGFATRGGEPWLAFAVMGGDMQPQGQVQVLVSLIDHGLDLQQAGDLPRWRHDGSSQPVGRAADGIGTLLLEPLVPNHTRKELTKLGWRLGPPDHQFGGYQAVQRVGGVYGGASERRKDGIALAY